MLSVLLIVPPPISKSQQEELVKLGEKFKAIRQQKGYTLEQVALNIGKDRQSIHRLEKGDFNPSYVYLLEVCKGLEIDISELFAR